MSVSLNNNKLKINPLLTDGQDSFCSVEWKQFDVVMNHVDGHAIFEKRGVEFPATWDQQAVNIVTEKYFNPSKDEMSLKQLVGRVCDTISRWGGELGYFDGPASVENFRNELIYMVLHQMMAFNSPVWFNCGVDPQAMLSACFIQSVEDTMESIMGLVANEARIFQNGGGTGTNFSTLRASVEALSRGGTASGPVSFMKGFDAFAGVIKSGGRLRRAAKMNILNVDHPDIDEFIQCKALEERQLKEASELDDIDYEYLYNNTHFQNANHSIRVTDDFMKAAQNDDVWWTREVKSGKKHKKYKARQLLMDISKAAHECGDPGLQYHSTINDWNPLLDTKANPPVGEVIVASNPCSEFLFLNDSACNLASLNLMKFVDTTRNDYFDVKKFQHAVKLTLLAQEIIIDQAKYPTDKIKENSQRYRPLGLGHANLGGLLMVLGHPYDSDAGRSVGAAITSLMTATAYDFSSDLARVMGPFEGYDVAGKAGMLRVLNKHMRAHKKMLNEESIEGVIEAGFDTWVSAVKKAKDHGVRNAQVTLEAPTGTIGFMMGVATTGIEPDLALIKNKTLVSGGTMQIVNPLVPLALKNLGYTTEIAIDIVAYIKSNNTIEGAPGLNQDHLPVFDCSMLSRNRFIAPMGHVRMLSAVQPFISGACSKTVNLPKEATVEDIYDVYVKAWELGVKCIALYRDGSKAIQPMTTGVQVKKKKKTDMPPQPNRKPMPNRAVSLRHKFELVGHKGYIHVGQYEDGKPGEIFIRMNKAGSTINGLMDNFGIAVSLGLQYGVPLDAFVAKFANTRFEPQGWTGNQDIRMASSILDYIFRWIELEFKEKEPEVVETETNLVTSKVVEDDDGKGLLDDLAAPISDGPPCPNCGFLTVRNGTCFKCSNCGNSLGCS